MSTVHQPREHRELVPDHVHVTPVRTYVGIYGALLVLTALTVGVAFVDLGPLGTPVALAIATLKGSLVAAWFMDLRSSEPFNTFVLLAAVVALMLFFSLTMLDFTTRELVHPEHGTRAVERE